MICTYVRGTSAFLAMGYILLWLGSAEAYYYTTTKTYTYTIYGASSETTNFVRGVLRDLDIKKPEAVFIAKGGDGNSGSVTADFAQELSNPRIITVHEDTFKQLSENQKRFIVARVVLGEQSVRSLWRRFERVICWGGTWLASYLGFRFFGTPGLPAGRLYCIPRSDSPFVRRLVAATAVSLLLGGYLERIHSQNFDIEAGIYCGDVESAIKFIEAEQKKYDEKYPFTTYWGQANRGIDALLKPFSWTPSKEARLRYFRELAREQMPEPPAQTQAATKQSN